MSVFFERESKTFHLRNRWISYVMKILPNDQLGHLYFGKAVSRKGSYDYLIEPSCRPMSSYVFEGEYTFSLEHTRQEYPSYGTGDFRDPAIGIRLTDGSTVSDFHFERYEVKAGKPVLEGLPATYCEDEGEAETLKIFLKDPFSGVRLELLYTVFTDLPAIARSVRIVNEGEKPVQVERAMSLCLDLPDSDYEWLQLSGAWARERHIRTRKLEQGIQSVGSTRGNSSHIHNPFIVLKRPETTELSGEALGFSLVYSGNFLAQAEADTWNITRVLMGIHPFGFSWHLEKGESLQLPEAVMVYSDEGLGGMSHAYHKLYRDRLVRGYWRDRERPILINSWEAAAFDISEEKLVKMASLAARFGVELFALDDGWFGDRDCDLRGLGDWHRTRDCLPAGLSSLAEKVEAEGLKFGIWVEPEMVNKDSDLFREHEDWVLSIPGRNMTHSRNQYVLDLSRREVVDHLYASLSDLLRSADISYVKWDMNRSITEAFSARLPAKRQGEVMHRYILGLYNLMERLTDTFPEVLFESCASGGGRFDPGMLYYTPQIWLSDDSDAAERLMMQYGTSLCYPISCFGTHLSSSPNQQVYRSTPAHTRANVAFFGTFGYELDPGELSDEEISGLNVYTDFMKEYRGLFMKGTFYRLVSPFENRNFASWMVVSPDRRTAIAGWYKLLNEVNGPFHRLKLAGLSPDISYRVRQTDRTGRIVPYRPYTPYPASEPADAFFTGDELMLIGLPVTDSSAGELRGELKPGCDFDSRLYILEMKEM